MKLTVIPLLAVLLLFGACTSYTTTCHLGNLEFQFIGFDSTDLDTVVVKTYYSNSTIPVHDSVVLTSGDYPGSYQLRGDTSLIPLYISADTLDKEVIIPALSRSIRITEIVSEPPSSNTTKYPFFVSVKMDACTRRVVSYKIDGVLVTMPVDTYYNPITILR